jgi:hypothetical protein
VATKPRARKSSQTDWPWLSSALTGFMGLTALSGLRGERHLERAEAYPKASRQSQHNERQNRGFGHILCAILHPRERI